jgi:uncharacterized protein with HEPN domain
MSRDDALVLDIVLAAEDAQSFVQGMNFAAFEASRLHQNAVIRSLEIVGEATGKLSAVLKSAYPNLPWRSIKSMRNRLIHTYNEISLNIVWAVVQDDLPQIIATLKPLIPPRDQTP